MIDKLSDDDLAALCLGELMSMKEKLSPLRRKYFRETLDNITKRYKFPRRLDYQVQDYNCAYELSRKKKFTIYEKIQYLFKK